MYEYIERYLINVVDTMIFILMSEFCEKSKWSPILSKEMNKSTISTLHGIQGFPWTYSMGLIPNHSQGKAQSLPAGFAETSLHASLRSAPVIPGYSFGSLSSSSLSSAEGIPQTVCYLAQIKASLREIIFREDSLEKTTKLFLQTFYFLSSKKNHQDGHIPILLKVPTKIGWEISLKIVENITLLDH